LGAATGGNERRRRKNKTLKTKLNHSYGYNIPHYLKKEYPNFWGFFKQIESNLNNKDLTGFREAYL
jgi:hypothetical protein